MRWAKWPNCDKCGRFFVTGMPGTSWVHVPDSDVSWGENRERCARCTEKHGPAKPFGNYVEELVCGAVPRINVVEGL